MLAIYDAAHADSCKVLMKLIAIRAIPAKKNKLLSLYMPSGFDSHDDIVMVSKSYLSS